MPNNFLFPWGCFLPFVLSLAVCDTARADIDPQWLDDGRYYGAAPSDQSDFQKLQSLGIRHVIDMRQYNRRDSQQEAQLARRYGMCYQRLSVDFKPRYPDANIESVLRLLRCCSTGPIYVHCTLGRDRTGMVVAMYRQRYLGWPAEQAFQQKKEHEFNGLLIHYDRYFWDSVGRTSCEPTRPPENRNLAH